MKITRLVLCSALCVVAAACGTAVQQEKDYTGYVNPFIGTGGHGHTYPGAVVPNAMIQPSPDTRIYGWDACSGYYYEDTTINACFLCLTSKSETPTNTWVGMDDGDQ